MAIESFLNFSPQIDPSAFVAKSADVIGQVTLGENSSVWYQATLRGDIHKIEVGANSNIQDNSVLHQSDEYGTFLGEFVTVGHSAIIHACTIKDEVLVGMGACLMDGVVVGERSIIGAKSLITQGTHIPPGSLVIGSPARVVRSLTLEEQARGRVLAEKYVKNSRIYLARDQSETSL